MTRPAAIAAYRHHRTLAIATGAITKTQFDKAVAKEVGDSTDWASWEAVAFIVRDECEATLDGVENEEGW